jgi:hypothetical protein
MVRTRFLVRVCQILFASVLVLAAWRPGAAQLTPPQDASRKISGFAVIDRVITAGTEPVFRADGYALRVNSGTNVRFSGGPTSLIEVGTNFWVRYEGEPNGSGEIVLSTAEFIKRKLHKPKRDSKVSLAQVTTFPQGSMIDFDLSFRTDSENRRTEDAGGDCGSGWYPVPADAALQDRVRRVGVSVVPQYQRDLPDDDPAKIPFRFYAIEEPYMRFELACEDGLILVPVTAVERMQNDSQLAAVLADGVAANLQRQNVRMQMETRLIDAAESAAWMGGMYAGAAGFAGKSIVMSQIQRKMEQQRGRIALALMADAGLDPSQAPEAWRMLAPGKLPKNLAKLKYPARSQYQLEILRLQLKPAASSTSTPITDQAPLAR